MTALGAKIWSMLHRTSEFFLRSSPTLFIAASIALVAFSGFGAIISIANEGFGQNGAAWVQAGGSIGAITGAVWLFQREAIRRRHERRAAGEEVAWGVRFALTNAQFEARTIATELVDERLVKKESPRRYWLLRTENCRNVLKVYAERTDHIHPVLNHIASNGMLLLRQMDEDLDLALGFIEGDKRPSTEIATKVAWYEAHFEELLQLLDARMRGILRALDEGGGSLPMRHLAIWDAPDDVNSTYAKDQNNKQL